MEKDKRSLRAEYLRTRNEMPPEEAREKSLGIFRNLLGLPEYSSARRVFAYASYKNEAETLPMIEDAVSRGKAVALPRILGKRRMEFYSVKGLSGLIRNPMGILEPEQGEILVPGGGDLFIVPGTAFDLMKNRLGAGGGYYDAYFERYGGDFIKAGIAFDFQIAEELPCFPYDIKMDMIITEKRIIR